MNSRTLAESYKVLDVVPGDRPEQLDIFGEAEAFDGRAQLPSKRAVACHDHARGHGPAKFGECLDRQVRVPYAEVACRPRAPQDVPVGRERGLASQSGCKPSASMNRTSVAPRR